MKKIRYLNFSMDFPIRPYEVSKLRGAMLNAMEDAPDLFHQHTDTGVIYRYPLIQYKVIRGKPTIVCLEDGADIIHHFFQNRKKPLKINGKSYQPEIEKIYLKYHLLQVWDRDLYFAINNWLPFNQENHKEYLELTSLVERTEFLERILRNHIVQFAHELEWDIEREIKVRIRKVYPPKSVTYKGMHYESYKLDFYTNVSLPDYVGLGKAASTGFGVVWGKRDADRTVSYGN